MSTYANSEDPDAAFHQGLLCKGQKNFRQKNMIFFENYNLKPLEMYNGLFQVYCIELERRIHWYTKG